MKNFKTGGREREKERSFGGRPGFGGRSNFGGGKHGGSSFAGRTDRPERRESASEMFSATCTACGKSCEVPFKPTGDRPVFCRDCFGKQNDGRELRTEAPRREFPRESRPHARDERSPAFATPRPDNSLNDIKRQLTTLEGKLNRILDLINPPLPAKKAEATTIATPTVEVALVPKVRKVKTIAPIVKKVAAKKVVKKKVK